MKRVVTWILLSAAVAAAVPLVMASRLPEVATPGDIRSAWQPSYAFLLGRNGDVIDGRRMNFDAMRLPWVELDSVSPALLDVLVRVEDHRFWRHGGVDLFAVAAATRDALLNDSRRGASTLTMQLAAALAPEQTGRPGGRGLLAKWRQMRLAWAIESRWSKRDILEAYLNRVTFRGDLQGIGAGAAVLLGKDASGLTVAESALLATLVASPNAGARTIGERACALATAHGLLSDCSGMPVLADTALRRAAMPPRLPASAPHLARALLDQPGERVTTTLDSGLQTRVHAILSQALAGLSHENVRDGAAVVLDNRSGDVLAYVGSAGRDSTASQVDGAKALRQAGSTLKPFLYALAFEKRYLTPASVLDDSPIHLDTGTGLYIPQNYDRNFNGPVTAHTALASSLNVPAVRTLVLVGVDPFRDGLVDVGYRDITRDGDYYGFSLALGSAEVTLLQQANAYRTLANAGLFSPIRLRRDDEPSLSGRRAISAEAAFLVSETLSDPAARAVTFGLDSPLATPFWSAVKTGTSKDMRDNWCIGYSEHYTVAVWVGNFEGDSMQNVSGVTGAAPAWLEIMRTLHADRVWRAPLPPAGVHAMEVEFVPAIEPRRRGWFIDGTETARVELLAQEDLAPRIMAPANGTIIALDPDIPARNQRVMLKGRVPHEGYRLRLNDRPLGDALNGVRWTPTAGTHRLDLLGHEGQVEDSIRFSVR